MLFPNVFDFYWVMLFISTYQLAFGTLTDGFLDLEGKVRLGMNISKDGTSEIYLPDLEGKVRLAMAIPENGIPSIGFFNSEGKSRLIMGIFEDENPFLGFYGPDGKTIRALP